MAPVLLLPPSLVFVGPGEDEVPESELELPPRLIVFTGFGSSSGFPIPPQRQETHQSVG